MNILMLTTTYEPAVNGVAISLGRTVRELERLGHTVYLIGPKRDRKAENYFDLPTLGPVPFMAKDYPLSLPILLPWIHRNLNRTKWDIVHVHNPHFGILARLLGWYFQIPVVFTYHSRYDFYINVYVPWLPKIIRQFVFDSQVLRFCRQTDAIIAPTSFMKSFITRRVKHVPVYTITTAAVDREFRVMQSKPVLRHELNLPLNVPIYLLVSRLTREKNAGFIIRAFIYYLRKIDPAGHLVVIGEGHQRKRLERMLRSAGMGDHATFTGNIPNNELPRWYSAADVFIFSSISETAGLILIEAMSAGLPIVVLRHPSVSGLVEEGKTGYLVRGGVKMFAREMNQAYNDRVRLSENALAKAGDYTVRKSVSEILNVYISCITRYDKRH